MDAPVARLPAGPRARGVRRVLPYFKNMLLSLLRLHVVHIGAPPRGARPPTTCEWHFHRRRSPTWLTAADAVEFWTMTNGGLARMRASKGGMRRAPTPRPSSIARTCVSVRQDDCEREKYHRLMGQRSSVHYPSVHRLSIYRSCSRFIGYRSRLALVGVPAASGGRSHGLREDRGQSSARARDPAPRLSLY